MQFQQKYARTAIAVGLMLTVVLCVQPVLQPLHLLLHHLVLDDHAAAHAAHEGHVHACHDTVADGEHDQNLPGRPMIAAATGAGESACQVCEALQATGQAKTLLASREVLTFHPVPTKAFAPVSSSGNELVSAAHGRAPPVIAG